VNVAVGFGCLCIIEKRVQSVFVYFSRRSGDCSFHSSQEF
jgi:hypothetical protein